MEYYRRNLICGASHYIPLRLIASRRPEDFLNRRDSLEHFLDGAFAKRCHAILLGQCADRLQVSSVFHGGADRIGDVEDLLGIAQQAMVVGLHGGI